MCEYPLDIESVGSDTFIVMSKGHHDLNVFMRRAVEEYPGWFLGGPMHVWIKTTPVKVRKSRRGAGKSTFASYRAVKGECLIRNPTPTPTPVPVMPIRSLHQGLLGLASL